MSQIADELYYQQGRTDEAIAMLEQDGAWLKLAELLIVDIFISGTSPDRAFDVLAKLPADDPDVLDATGLAHYYVELTKDTPDFTTTFSLFERAYTIYDAIQHQAGLCKSLFHMGLVHQFSKRPDDARNCFQQSYDIARANNMPFEQSFAVRHLGFVADDPEQSHIHLEESLHLREALNCNLYLPFSHQSLAVIYQRMGDVDRALEHLQRGRAIAEKFNVRRALYLIDMSLGDIYVQREQWADAEAAYHRMKVGATDFGHVEVIALADQRLKELAERG